MAPPTRTKSRWETWWKQVRVGGLSVQRWARWAAEPTAFAAPVLAPDATAFPAVVWRRAIPIARRDPHATPLFEEGKRHNLRLAQPAFDGLLLGPDRTFSFWRTLGEATAARGFRHGMELSGGCVVPAIGGGLCLLSNSFYAMACELSCEIVERYGHSISAVPLVAGETWGLDATVFYPHIDLRLRAPRPLRLGVTVTADELIVEARAERPWPERVEITAQDERTERDGADEYRRNRLLRRRFLGETLLGEEIIADNRKRMMIPEEAGRSCLTCGDEACHTRPKDIAQLIVANDRHRRA